MILKHRKFIKYKKGVQTEDEVDRNLAINPKFSLFEHKEMYEPILNKLKEIDPESVKWRKYFWRRMCEPDIL